MIRIHLSRLLGELKMPQSHLAKQTGIRPNTISELYHETASRIDLDQLDKILEVLDCDIWELLERVPNTMKRTGKDLILEQHGNRKKPSL